MRFLLPMPFQSLVLFVVWLLLSESIAPGHIVLAAILAIGIPQLLRGVQGNSMAMQKSFKAVLYATKVFGDIVFANFEVAVQVLGPSKHLKPGFFAIPLYLKGEFLITILASTICLTPGTVSAEVSSDQKWLYVHALHLVDEAAAIEGIKTRYEKPLKEIFGC